MPAGADVLARYVVFELECTGRIYCNLYVPKPQRELGRSLAKRITWCEIRVKLVW